MGTAPPALHTPTCQHYCETEQLETIAAPVDFLGVNYYTRWVVRSAEATAPPVVFPAGDQTEMGWEVYPPGLYEVLGRLHFDYRFPLYFMTENGAAFPDVRDGRVHDTRRIAYLQEHLVQAHRAIQGGVPLQGYFVWSLLDNFEWAYGYTKRFGIVHVDFPTQRRTPKESAIWYSRLIRENGFSLDSAWGGHEA